MIHLLKSIILNQSLPLLLLFKKKLLLLLASVTQEIHIPPPVIQATVTDPSWLNVAQPLQI